MCAILRLNFFQIQLVFCKRHPSGLAGLSHLLQPHQGPAEPCQAWPLQNATARLVGRVCEGVPSPGGDEQDPAEGQEQEKGGPSCGECVRAKLCLQSKISCSIPSILLRGLLDLALLKRYVLFIFFYIIQ